MADNKNRKLVFPKPFSSSSVFEYASGDPLVGVGEKSSSYITVNWNLIASLCLVPFKLHWDRKTQQFVMKSGKLRKIISGVIAILSLISTSMWLIIKYRRLFFGRYPSRSAGNFLKLFDLIMSVSSGAKLIFFLEIAWRKKNILVAFVNQLAKLNLQRICIFKLLPLYGYMMAMLFFGIANTESYYDFRVLFPDGWNKYSTQSFLKWILKLVLFIGLFGSTAANFVFYSFVMTLSSVASSYERECLDLECEFFSAKIEKGFQLYSRVKALNKLANSLLGGFIFAIYFETLTYFADYVGALSKNEVNLKSLCQFAVNASTSGFVWVVACEFHRKVADVTNEWVGYFYEDRNLPLQERVRIIGLSNDFANAPIVISCQFFSVTYGFVGSLLGLIITYGLIIFQMQIPAKEST